MTALLNDRIHRQMDMLARHRYELHRAILSNGTDLGVLVARQRWELEEMIASWEREEK